MLTAGLSGMELPVSRHSLCGRQLTSSHLSRPGLRLHHTCETASLAKVALDRRAVFPGTLTLWNCYPLRPTPCHAHALGWEQLSDSLQCSTSAVLSSPSALQQDTLHAVDLENSAAALHNLLYTLAAAAAAADSSGGQNKSDWLTPIADGLQTVLTYIQDGLVQFHVPYSYGWSIVLLTLLVKVATYPFTKSQVESAMSVQKLKPQVDLIKLRYGDDKERVQRETSALYEKVGVNPLAGCLPTLATIPIFWGLFRALSDSASSGENADGFYWIPSLAGPTSVAARQAGLGTSWLFPFVDGAPPIGWEEASRYLVIPVLLVLAQFASTKIITPPADPNDDSNKTQKAIFAFLPLMIGWFALNVPSGLGLYYFSNTVLTTAQQVWLRKFGGAQVEDFDLGPIDVGQGRRTRPPAVLASAVEEASSSVLVAAAPAISAASSNTSNGASETAVATMQPAQHAAVDEALLRRCKRKRLTPAEQQPQLTA